MCTRIAFYRRDSLEHIRDDAHRLYELFLRDKGMTELYFNFIGIDGDQYDEFASTVTVLSNAHSVDDVQNYLDWRVQTNTFLQGVMAARGQIINEGEGIKRIDLEFVDDFRRLDNAIQFNELPGKLTQISKRMGLVTRTAGFLLFFSILVGLLSLTTTNSGIPDYGNLPLGILFLVVIFILLVYIHQVVRMLRMSSDDVIDELVATRTAGQHGMVTFAKQQSSKLWNRISTFSKAKT